MPLWLNISIQFPTEATEEEGYGGARHPLHSYIRKAKLRLWYGRNSGTPPWVLPFLISGRQAQATAGPIRAPLPHGGNTLPELLIRDAQKRNARVMERARHSNY